MTNDIIGHSQPKTTFSSRVRLYSDCHDKFLTQDVYYLCYEPFISQKQCLLCLFKLISLVLQYSSKLKSNSCTIKSLMHRQWSKCFLFFTNVRVCDHPVWLTALKLRIVANDQNNLFMYNRLALVCFEFPHPGPISTFGFVFPKTQVNGNRELSHWENNPTSRCGMNLIVKRKQRRYFHIAQIPKYRHYLNISLYLC